MNNIRNIIRAGSPTIGVFQVISSGLLSEGLAKTGFDWIVPDLQHGGITWDALAGILQGIELGGGQALVRVGWNDPMQIMRALDLGAAGVIVPMISTAADAKAAADAARYPPLGNRSLGPTRGMYDPAGLPRWIEDSNHDVLCFVMIETAAAMDNLDSIAAAPGVDGLFVGLADLTLSLKLPISDVGRPEVQGAVDRVVAACERNRIIPGTVAFSEGQAEDLMTRGMRLIAFGSDMGLLAAGAAQRVELAGRWKKRFSR